MNKKFCKNCGRVIFRLKGQSLTHFTWRQYCSRKCFHEAYRNKKVWMHQRT